MSDKFHADLIHPLGHQNFLPKGPSDRQLLLFKLLCQWEGQREKNPIKKEDSSNM